MVIAILHDSLRDNLTEVSEDPGLFRGYYHDQLIRDLNYKIDNQTNIIF